jgi:hypothetical protein
MSRLTIDHLHHQVLLALELAGQAEDLEHLSRLVQGSHRVAELMPVVGSLVSAGYLEKVAVPTASALGASPNRPLRGRVSGPVHFQLTEQGRRQLRDDPLPVRAQISKRLRAQGR